MTPWDSGWLTLKIMSAHNLIEFLPPARCEEGEAMEDPSWLEGRSWVPEVFTYATENAPADRKRRLPIAAWADGCHSAVPIVERLFPLTEGETKNGS